MDDHLLHEFVELRAATAEEIGASPSAGQLDDLLKRCEQQGRADWWSGTTELMERLGLEL